MKLSAAGAAALSLVACGSQEEAGPLVEYSWSGSLLGVDTSLRLFHAHDAVSIAAVKEITAEVKRLAGIFTLYVHGSDLSRLNQTGSLVGATSEMLEVVEFCRQLWIASEGLFDPTVQPLWELYADYYSEPRAADDPGPSAAAIARAREKVGLDKVIEDKGTIKFAADGMALSFNAVAQGYLTDKAYEILKKRGFRHALINMGEYRAIGGKPLPDGDIGPWHIGIADATAPWRVFETLQIMEQAVSTSAPSGAAFNTGGTSHHLFNPRTGLSENRYHSVTVVAPTATIADGLSTVLALVDVEQARKILSHFEGAGAFLRPLEGDPVRIGI
ncbi:MAG: FAD:protein FMN transferase [Alphaproteobacteria bacterium]|nr:FAD:protein FMN transferase [Alphaproteobacteria bacterium]